MRTFFELPDLLVALIITAFGAVMAADLYCVIVCSIYKVKLRNSIFPYALFAASFLSLFVLIGGHGVKDGECYLLSVYDFANSLPAFAVVSALLVLAALSCVLFILSGRWRKNNICFTTRIMTD